MEDVVTNIWLDKPQPNIPLGFLIFSLFSAAENRGMGYWAG
jgi:hypothetical protein